MVRLKLAGKYLIRALGLILIIISLNFLLIHLMPGDPLVHILGEEEYFTLASQYNGMLYATSYEDYIKSFQDAQVINSEQCPVICLAIPNAYYPYRIDAITGWEYYPAWGVINNATWYTISAK